MISVHVWLANDQHVGHASLTVNDDYVSFWPDGTAGKKDLKTKASQPGLLAESLREDIRNEGHRQPITLRLEGLNEAAVLDYVALIRSGSPRYQIARHNCCHVVADALKAGTGRQPSFTPRAGHYGTLGRNLGAGIWTPDQVLRFAVELGGR